jgi:nicotinate phosphoribosyltransferase
MILSILDTDLYKFSTSYAYMKLYPEAEGTFTFCDRNNTIFDEKFIETLDLELSKLCMLSLTLSEKQWCIKHIPYIPEVYWEWLKGFKFDWDKICTWLDDDKHLHIEVTDYLYKVTLYEVPILAIVSELLTKQQGMVNVSEAIDKLDVKINLANEHNLKFSEFGTRRRASSNLHDLIVQRLKEKCPINCVGTSNVYFAMKYNMTPIGTFPHEWIMFHGACWGYQEANYLGMRDWIRTYDGNLGIFLMDTYTSKVGLKNMSLKFAKLFDGVRQDSGDEYKIGNEVINRYKELGIDPTTKTIVFSNALDFPKYLDIYNYFNGRIRVSAGIGTNLTNDVDFKPANIVMKLSKCRINKNQEWRKCIKISDDLGKHLGDDKEFEIAKYQLNI